MSQAKCKLCGRHLNADGVCAARLTEPIAHLAFERLAALEREVHAMQRREALRGHGEQK